MPNTSGPVEPVAQSLWRMKKNEKLFIAHHTQRLSDHHHIQQPN